jgi:hypothetical protein
MRNSNAACAATKVGRGLALLHSIFIAAGLC